MSDSEQFRNMNRDNRERHFPSGSNVLMGMLVVAGGVMLLLHKLGVSIFPYWLFRWPLILIFVGLIVGIKSKFQNIGWLVLILLGSFFLLKDVYFFHWHIGHLALPIGIIIIGLLLIMRSATRPSRLHGFRNWDRWADHTSDEPDEINAGSTGDEYINATNVFGGTKKRIYSKAFKGGQTTNLFGSTELDLTQADLAKNARIDMMQMFGGVKLLVPADWVVKSDVACIFGGVEDKRPTPNTISEPPKVITLTGVCIFGGVQIKSY